ncbi:hypothetical protein BV25DRAFT_1827001 [Artomyces pyxidatus]|uniref:Uncharacterized protein n=1 Tax=Artomyces pyxidatus TaxID=48021 RepID=A0ACB8SZ20_9AGAM|nr:hypothetical protein BV25DRAFT_1827001 [Artomyces pyxidatus]
MPLQSQSYVFDPRPHFPFLVSVKRYWVPGLESTDPSAPTLIFTHGAGFYKEQWEPVLEELYDFVATAVSTGGKVTIRDAWAIEAPDHGESAVLNEKELHKQNVPSAFSSASAYTTAVHLVLSGQGKGLDVDFKDRNLFALGNSLGCIPLIMSRALEPVIPWRSAILVNPAILHPAYNLRTEALLVTGAERDTDIWPNREAARKVLHEQTLNTWDSRAIDVFLNYGLRELPTADYPAETKGVTLKHSRVSETATYGDSESRLAASRYLLSFCMEIPTYAIFGAVEANPNPVSSREVIVRDLAVGNLKTANIIDGVGHFCIQQDPAGVAEHVYSALAHFKAISASKSKL